VHILLLNPPGKLCYSRDYFCSKVTKAGYAEHPVDLLVLSGILYSTGHKLTLIDAIVEKLSFSFTAQRINALKPDVTIFLSGTTSWKDDFVFLADLKKSHPKMLLVGLGDIFLDAEILHKNDWLDAVILDFTKPEILDYIAGRYGNFESLGFRREGSIYFPAPAKASGEPRPCVQGLGEFSIPIPRHEMFLGKKYAFPFARRIPFTTLLTDYGCPFACRFCLYPSLGYKRRKLENVFDELRYIHSLGIRELFIKDQSFGTDRLRTASLCQEMRKIGKFSWTCFLRTDIAEEGLLENMKKSGCHTVMFGVESANPRILSICKPGVNMSNIKRAFQLCQRLKINTVGIFILGFPGEDKKSCLETIALALDLKCDFASFNLFVPKIETPLRKDLMTSHAIEPSQNEILDQSGIASVWSNGCLSRNELDALRRCALRKFYLRPNYLAKKVFNSFYPPAKLQMHLKSLLFIFRDLKGKMLDG
jgi:anaerobic magnesium-protoporphyrin IX monomethyl ester cyclase